MMASVMVSLATTDGRGAGHTHEIVLPPYYRGLTGPQLLAVLCRANPDGPRPRYTDEGDLDELGGQLAGIAAGAAVTTPGERDEILSEAVRRLDRRLRAQPDPREALLTLVRQAGYPA